jgi:PAS domain S-box-containing protein
MKPNTALATLALGVAVRSLAIAIIGAAPPARPDHGILRVGDRRLRTARARLRLDLGIDQLLLSDPWTNLAEAVPGRPSLPTAAGLTLLSSAVLLADAMLAQSPGPGDGDRGRQHRRTRADRLRVRRPGALRHPALRVDRIPAARSRCCCSRWDARGGAERGVASLVAADSSGGALTRRLVPIAVGVPFVLVGAAQAAAQRGFLNGEVATALLVVSLAAVMGAIVLHAAGSIHRLDGARARVDAMLREATSRVRHLSAVLDASSIAVVSFDGLGRVVTWNPAAERVFGLRASGAVGRRTSEVFRPETARAVANALEPVLRRGESRRVQITVERADGTRVEGLLAIAPLVDWERRVAGACAVLHELPDAVASERPRVNEVRSRDMRAGSVVARVGGGVILLGLSLWVLRPFLVPVVWAAILAYVTWPLYRFVRHKTQRPRSRRGSSRSRPRCSWACRSPGSSSRSRARRPTSSRSCANGSNRARPSRPGSRTGPGSSTGCCACATSWWCSRPRSPTTRRATPRRSRASCSTWRAASRATPSSSRSP